VDLKNKWIPVFAPFGVALPDLKKEDILKLQNDGFERHVEVIHLLNHREQANIQDLQKNETAKYFYFKRSG
jgi:hypothetical protein